MLTELPRAVVFDMDGLLLDSEAIYKKAIFSACADQGHAMSDEIHARLVGTPIDLGNEIIMSHFGGSFDLDRYHVDCHACFEALSADGVPLRPGAQALLETLALLQIPAAIATSTVRTVVEPRLTRSGVAGAFQTIVTRTEVSKGKPHPETFLKAAAGLGIDPASCLALEDSHNGVRAAAAAGMITVMIPDMLPATDEMTSLCAAIVPSLHDVRKRLLEVRPK